MVIVRFVNGPLPPRVPAAPREESGAVLVFEGWVRATEGSSEIAALTYEAYRPMADRILTELAAACMTRGVLHRVEVEHSLGRVPAGACSFRLIVEAPHRRDALIATEWFIDRMKADAPIWKQPVWVRAAATRHAEP